MRASRSLLALLAADRPHTTPKKALLSVAQRRCRRAYVKQALELQTNQTARGPGSLSECSPWPYLRLISLQPRRSRRGWVNTQ
jgi:hypothetical protein